MAKKAEPVTWGVYRLRKKAQRIGSVDARDQKEALEKAYEQYEIPEKERFRISVQRD